MLVFKVSADGKTLLTLSGEDIAKELAEAFEPGEVVEVGSMEDERPRFILFGDQDQ